MAESLDAGMVLVHPFIIGEIALGNLRQRDLILESLEDLPHAPIATDGEVLHFISRQRLFGRGIGYIDAHLLAAVRMAEGAALWTHDARLQALAEHAGVAIERARN